VTFDEVKRAVQELNIFPRQLFTEDEMKQDRTFGKIFEENSTLKADNERLSKENKEIKTTSEVAVKKTAINESKGKLEELMKEGFTDKQKSFITKEFDPEKTEDLSDEGMKKVVEEGKKKFAEAAKLFGVEDTSNGGKKKKLGGEGTGDETDMEEEALKLIGAIDSGDKS